MQILIDGAYSNGHTYKRTVEIADPPDGVDITDWLSDEAFDHTGDGQPSNLGSHDDVTVLEAANPAHVGATYEFMS